MKYFIEHAWCVDFFFILDERRPVLPFGICGPFAKKREAKKAAAKLRTKIPGSELSVHRAWLPKSLRPNSLMESRAEARTKLKNLLKPAGLTKE